MTAPHVVILTWCWRPSALYGSTLVFRTLRTGFPTARVTVFDNRSAPSCQNEIRAAATASGCEFIALEEPVSHDAWVRRVLTEYPLAGPVAIVDPDVVFWSDVEGWDFDDALMAGRLIPELFDDIVMHARTMPRLHTSFLWIPDVARLRARIRGYEEADRIGTLKMLRLLELAVVIGPGGRVFFDTAANLYAAIRDECAVFGERELDAYDHLFLGSHVEILERSGAIAPGMIPADHAAARDGDLEALRGLWRKQDERFRTRAPAAQSVTSEQPVSVESAAAERL